ncbi:histidine kinase [Eubacteriales bacterium OttesenSCG-928-A19]|nr:histidine kinase [Eubacteriales bacterium OttesenSCG-928-A19]
MPKLMLILCKGLGFGLLFLSWMESAGSPGAGEAIGFLPIIVLAIMTVLRLRLPKLWPSIAVDGILLLCLGHYLALSVFVISELFYRAWEKERERGLKLRDTEAGKYYELEQLQGDLLAASAQIERMTAVAERARIAREIHDSAGHEIVAAYMSFQTARNILDNSNAEALALYDAALDRLNSGAVKIRDAVHNLSTTTFIGVDNLREVCRRFPVCQVDFSIYGDSSKVPVYVWSMLESCMRESLTNIARHAAAKRVSASLDITPRIVRLCIENDGAGKDIGVAGIGLRNLRHRAAAIGGSLSVDAGEMFRVICVIPIGESK